MVITPAFYRVTITHTRYERVRRTFRHRALLWWVDLDDLPRLPWPLRSLVRFRVRDHGSGRGPSIRADMDAWLAERGWNLAAGRMEMLAAPAVLGYAFNPLSVYWCHYTDGSPVCVVAEVHNTYSGRHRYLLVPDADGRAGVAKDFYVSPFFPVDGRYEMVVPKPGQRVQLAVRLVRPDHDGTEHTAFAVSVTGRRSPARTATVLRSLASDPWPSMKVAVLIRYHGIRLWLRGLPAFPRPSRKTI